MKIYLKKSGDRYNKTLIEFQNRSELLDWVIEDHGNSDWSKNPNKMTIDELCEDRWDNGWRRCNAKGE